VKAYKRHGSLDTFSSGTLSTGQCLKIEKFDGSGSMDVSETLRYLLVKDRSAFFFRGTTVLRNVRNCLLGDTLQHPPKNTSST
jgi:hypothetical protein